jgi:hypothetical protein
MKSHSNVFTDEQAQYVRDLRRTIGVNSRAIATEIANNRPDIIDAMQWERDVARGSLLFGIEACDLAGIR